MSDKNILIEISISDLRELIKECVTAAMREEKSAAIESAIQIKRESVVSRAEKIAMSRELYALGKPYRVIAEIVLGDSEKQGTIYKWLNY